MWLYLTLLLEVVKVVSFVLYVFFAIKKEKVYMANQNPLKLSNLFLFSLFYKLQIC